MSGSSDATWSTNGNQTNPSSNTVLADTGAIETTGVFRVHVMASADVAATIATQHRNGANDTSLHDHRDYLAAGSPIQRVFTFTISAGERLRVILVSAITGNICASLNSGRKDTLGY